MIIQPEKGTRNVNDLFYEAERNRIDLLNREFFQNVELTKSENEVLVWLCGWDEWTISKKWQQEIRRRMQMPPCGGEN